MHRFFVAPESISSDGVTLSGDQARQISRVLRLKRGDRIVVLDNSGSEYEVELNEVSPVVARGRVLSKTQSQSEPTTQVTVYQSLLKGSKFEYVLQKCTEVGVTAFVPLVCNRCVADASKVTEAKMVRWRDIVREAAEQSRRGRLPALSWPISFQEACDAAPGLRLLPWEGEMAKGLRAALREARAGNGPLSLGLLIGPEGGFDPAEVDYARERGVVPVTLGPRTLRAETAALVAASAILYQAGDLGG